MISSAGLLGEGEVEVGVQTLALAVDDPPLQPLGDRQLGHLGGPLGLGVGGGHALEQLQERCSGS